VRLRGAVDDRASPFGVEIRCEHFASSADDRRHCDRVRSVACSDIRHAIARPDRERFDQPCGFPAPRERQVEECEMHRDSG
jgi:hypothetical protein